MLLYTAFSKFLNLCVLCVCMRALACVCMHEWVYVRLGLVINAQVKLSCGMRVDKVNHGMQC